MGHIFISYSRQDQDLADKIIRVLAKAGAKVWIDREGIAGGVKWRREIVEAVPVPKLCKIGQRAKGIGSD